MSKTIKTQFGAITESNMVESFNRLRMSSLKKSVSARACLEAMSEEELFIFVAGKTYQYGRSFDASVENALLKLEKGRAYIIECFAKKDPESTLGVTVTKAA